jgi:hypothetical protein
LSQEVVVGKGVINFFALDQKVVDESMIYVGQLILLYNTIKLGWTDQMSPFIHRNFLFGLWKVETKAVSVGNRVGYTSTIFIVSPKNTYE